MTDSNAILLLVPGFPADESDSSCLPAIQNYVEALGNRLPKRSIDVVAFQYPFEPRSYRWRRASVHALAGRNTRFGKPRTWWRALRTGRRLMAGRCGTIHSFWLGECALIGSILARRPGWVHVVSIGGQEVRGHTIYTRLLRHAAFTLTAGSGLAADDARRRLRRSVDAVIPLGIDAGRTYSQASDSTPGAWSASTTCALSVSTSDASSASTPGASWASTRPIDLLAVGSLIPVKRITEVVDVASRLVRGRPDLTVVIVGEGPGRSQLEARIRDARLGNNVMLRGKLPRGKVLELMRSSKILLHPSEYESQGYVFLEALSAGMYVVCREVGFHPPSANVHHVATIDEMVAAIAQRLENPQDPESTEVPTADWTVDAFSAYYASSHGMPAGVP